MLRWHTDYCLQAAANLRLSGQRKEVGLRRCGGVQRRGLWCWGLKCGSWWFLKDELLYVGVGNTSRSWSESTICCYWLILTGIKDILPVFLQLAIPLQYLQQVGHNRKTLLAGESEPQPQHHGGGKGGGEDGHQSEREKIYNCRPGY